ncbi:MAG TPA: sugar phosphate isomerase/epimerase family protein [Chthonomonadaceae bacterium]|nr:sugar phosphate isomerase/epimerase family protein [Chthonomonadaceae bacterium]
MSSEATPNQLSRRAFLRRASFSAAGLLLFAPETSFARQNGAKTLYNQFRWGLQSYSLRHFSVDDALAKTQALGLKWWEGYPAHFPVTDDPKTIAEYQDKLKAHDIRMVSYGVVDFSSDEADARRKFAFAKAMGIETLTASPQPDALSLLDKLTAEYNIRIGIHNHGPNDTLYGTWEKLLAAIEGHSARIGACLDTGHSLRAGDSPVTAAAKFGKRLYDVHLKNVKVAENGEKEFTEIGATGGLLDTIGFFKELRKHGYSGLVALEYEEHEENPSPYIEQCFAALRRMLVASNL